MVKIYFLIKLIKTIQFQYKTNGNDPFPYKIFIKKNGND